jgi:uncharacterized protein (TIRG00374 family)
VKTSLLRWAGRIIGVAIVATLLAYAFRTLDLSRLSQVLGTVRIAWVVLACMAYAAILPLWALQWSIIAPRTPLNSWRRMLTVVALTSATLNTTPLLVGEVAGAMLLVSRIGLSAAEAVSVSMMDQLLVGIGKITVIAAAALTNPLSAWLTRGLLGLLTGVVLLFAACVALAFSNESSTQWIGNPRIASMLHRLANGLQPLRSVRRALPAIAIALAKRGVELLAVFCVQQAFGVALPISSSLLIVASLNLATLLPVVPGNLGIYEGVVAFAYVALGVSPERAAAMALVQHACFFASLALPGYLWVGAAGLSRSVAAAR